MSDTGLRVLAQSMRRLFYQASVDEGSMIFNG